MTSSVRWSGLVATSTAAAIAMMPCLGAQALAQDADTVRVIHLVIDALHPDQIGPQTPFLPQLKDEAVSWEQHRAVMASETLPNHVAMATGTYPFRNGIAGNDGRAAVGDQEPSDPDLGVPDLREAFSFTQAIEAACPDLRTVTVFSKQYVWRTFSTDPADANFDQPQFNIPESGHALDAITGEFILQELGENGAPDYLFANLGDVDRSGHIDASGFTGFPTAQLAALEQTDKLVGAIVEQLRQSGAWDNTVLVVNSDHSMDWSTPGQGNVDVEAALEGDERTAGAFFNSLNGGASSVYLLDPARADADAVLAAAREVILTLDGVDEALHREPNLLDPGNDLRAVHPAWRNWTPRAGEIFVTTLPGFKVGSQSANPLPGNHGMGATRHATLMITGGWDGLAPPVSIGVEDASLVNPTDDTELFPGQSEQVDLAPTYGWLLGVPDPGQTLGSSAPQWQGRVLEEAFQRQPTPRCAAVAPAVDDTPAAPGPDGQPSDEPLPATGAAAVAAGLAGLGLWLAVRRR